MTDSRQSSPWLRYGVRLGVGLALVVLLAWRSDISQFEASFRQLKAGHFAVAVAVFLFATVLAALRWKLLLRELSLGQLLRYSFIGQFYAMVLPGQIAGEAMKAYRIAATGVSGGRVAASVLLDRLVGTLGLAVVACAGLPASDHPVARALAPVFAALIAALVVTLGVVAMPASVRVIGGFLRAVRSPRIAARLARLLADTLDALHHFSGSWWRLAASFLIGVVFQLCAVVIYAGLASSIGISIGLADWLWIVAVASIAVLLPVSVGGLGLREGALVGCLAAFAVPSARSVALSLAVFAIMAIGAAIGGLLELLGRQQEKVAR